MNFFDLLERMENPGVHYTDFGSIVDKNNLPPEEDLYEFELARLAARQCGEMLNGVLNEELFYHLSRELSLYRGLKIKATVGTRLFAVAKPDY